MLLSVCMKDYVARSYGHTPRKLPLKSVPLRATSRFIAYQAEIIILYLLRFVKKNFSIYDKKYIKSFTKFQARFCAFSPMFFCRFFTPKSKILLKKGFFAAMRPHNLPDFRVPHATQFANRYPFSAFPLSPRARIYNKEGLALPQQHRNSTNLADLLP